MGRLNVISLLSSPAFISTVYLGSRSGKTDLGTDGLTLPVINQRTDNSSTQMVAAIGAPLWSSNSSVTFTSRTSWTLQQLRGLISVVEEDLEHREQSNAELKISFQSPDHDRINSVCFMAVTQSGAVTRPRQLFWRRPWSDVSCTLTGFIQRL